MNTGTLFGWIMLPQKIWIIKIKFQCQSRHKLVGGGGERGPKTTQSAAIALVATIINTKNILFVELA